MLVSFSFSAEVSTEQEAEDIKEKMQKAMGDNVSYHLPSLPSRFDHDECSVCGTDYWNGCKCGESNREQMAMEAVNQVNSVIRDQWNASFRKIGNKPAINWALCRIVHRWYAMVQSRKFK